MSVSQNGRKQRYATALVRNRFYPIAELVAEESISPQKACERLGYSLEAFNKNRQRYGQDWNRILRTMAAEDPSVFYRFRAGHSRKMPTLKVQRYLELLAVVEAFEGSTKDTSAALNIGEKRLALMKHQNGKFYSKLLQRALQARKIVQSRKLDLEIGAVPFDPIERCLWAFVKTMIEKLVYGKDAAKQIGLTYRTIHRWRKQNPEAWKRAWEAYGIDWEDEPKPRMLSLARMHRATELLVQGVKEREAARRVGLKSWELKKLKHTYPEHIQKLETWWRQKKGIGPKEAFFTTIRDSETGQVLVKAPRVETRCRSREGIDMPDQLKRYRGNHFRGKRKKAKGGRKRAAGGRNPSPARPIIKENYPQIKGQRLVNLINQRCSRQISEEKMRKMTPGGLGSLLTRMRNDGTLPIVT